MSVDLRNYVQVNIRYNEVKPLNRTRDTAVLFTLDSDENAPRDRLNSHTPVNGTSEVDYFVSLADYVYAIAQYNANVAVKTNDYYNITDDADPYRIWSGSTWTASQTAGSGRELGTIVIADLPANPPLEIIDTDENPVLYNYVKCFFANGGVKLKIKGGFEEDTSGSAPSLDEQKVTWIVNECVKLPAENIVITADVSEAIMEEVAKQNVTVNIIGNAINNSTSVSALSGYKEKVFVTSTDDKTLTISSPDKVPNLVIKYGPAGIEMTIAAYLTQVNIDDSRTINDYNFTIEDVSMFTNAVQDDNDTVVGLLQKHFNVDTTMVNNIRNNGGDTVNGLDLMNYYMRIILTQTLTDRIINILVTKIKFDRTGINKVVNGITQELNLYKTNGYLNSEFIWTEEDLKYVYNGQEYTVCARNTPFKMGYKFIVLPISALTQEQRDAHVFPPVYVVIADSMSVRQIVINGDAY